MRVRFLGRKPGRILSVDVLKRADESLDFDGAEMIACSWSYGIVVGQSGASSWGDTSNGQTGHDTKEDYIDVPQPISALSSVRIKYLAVGWAHSLFVAENGGLFSCGLNAEGQLGAGDTISRSSPSRVDFATSSGELVSTVYAAAGEAHSIVIATTGEAFAFGRNTYGQLGLGNHLQQNSPKQILGAVGVLKAACGANHTLLLIAASDDDSDEDNNTSEPTTLESGNSATGIASTHTRTVIGRCQGDVFSFGFGGFSQLGHDDTEDEPIPRLVEALEGAHVTDIASGTWHCAAVTANGKVYTWGWNEDGQLGLGRECGSSGVPRLVDTGAFSQKRFVAVACGARHTIAQTDDGQVYGFGLNQFGQLGGGRPARSPVVDLSGTLEAGGNREKVFEPRLVVEPSAEEERTRLRIGAGHWVTTLIRL